MFLSNSSIRIRFLIPLVGLILLLMVSVSTLFIHHEANSLETLLLRKQTLLENKMREQARTTTANLNLLIERALAQYDFTYIRTVVDQSSKEIPDLAHLSIANHNGEILFSSDQAMLEKKLVFTDKQMFHKEVWQGRSVLELHRPIHSAGDVWGTMVLALTFDALDHEITLSRMDMDRNLQEIRYFAWLMGTVFTVIGVIIVVVTVRHITVPLLTLTEAVDHVTANIATLEIPTFPGNGEVARLSRVFRSMLDRIRSYLDELKEMNLSLENKVRERTQDLAQKALELENANRNIIDSIKYAKNIQNAILPKHELLNQCIEDFFVIWQPKDIVGGDFYWFRQGRDHEEGYLIALADCTGHGVPGALMAMTTYSLMREIITIQNFSDPASILMQLNRSLRTALGQEYQDAASDDGLDMGLCHVNPKQGQIVFAGARQPFYYVNNDKIYRIKGDRHSIGYKNSNPDFIFKNNFIDIGTGIQCYLTSDGFYDQCGGDQGYSFNTDRFEALIKEHHRQPNQKQGILFMHALQTYQGNSTQMDDISMIGFRVEQKSQKQNPGG
ncbi:MAG: SpoIIE family protein phosphatase [Magnetococcus sp. YQC-5]